MPSWKLECRKQVAKYGLRAMHNGHQHTAGQQSDIRCQLLCMCPRMGRPAELHHLPEEFLLSWWKCASAKTHGMHEVVSDGCVTQILRNEVCVDRLFALRLSMLVSLDKIGWSRI